MPLFFPTEGKTLGMLWDAYAPLAYYGRPHISGTLFMLFVALVSEAATAQRRYWVRCHKCWREFYTDDADSVRCEECRPWRKERLTFVAHHGVDRGYGQAIVRGQEMTLAEIGEVMGGVSRGRIHQLECHALDKIRRWGALDAFKCDSYDYTPDTDPDVSEALSYLPPEASPSDWPLLQGQVGWVQSTNRWMHSWFERVEAAAKQERWAAERRAEQEAHFDF